MRSASLGLAGHVVLKIVLVIHVESSKVIKTFELSTMGSQILRAPEHSRTALQSSRSVCSFKPGRTMLALTISADFPGTLFLETVMAGRRDSMAAEAADEADAPPGKLERISSLCRLVTGDDAVDDVAPVPLRPALPGDPDDPVLLGRTEAEESRFQPELDWASELK